MRQERIIQATIFDVFAEHEIGRELKAVSRWLDEHRALLSLVASDLRRHGVQETGRHGLPAEAVLRGALLKQYRQLSYEELAFHLEDSASFRAFARLPFSWSPKKSVLHKTISAIGAASWEAINRAVVSSARQEKLESGATVRIDSTVTKALMHAPTDSSLLWDAVRVMVRLLGQASALPGAPPIVTAIRRAVADARRRARRRAGRRSTRRPGPELHLPPTSILRCCRSRRPIRSSPRRLTKWHRPSRSCPRSRRWPRRFPRWWLRRTIVWRRLSVRSGAVRLHGACAWTLVRSRRIAWSVRWLVRRRVSRLVSRLAHGRRSGLPRRRLLHERLCSGGVRRTQMLHLLPRYGLPGMCCQGLLPGGEGHRWRRRCRLSDDGATSHGSRGHCNPVRSIGMNSEHAVGSRRDRHSRVHRRGGNFACVDLYC